MYQVDGMTSTQAIREYEKANNLPKCRIIALTGLASASARLEALNSGVDHFMTKPMDFRALETLLKKGNERRRKHSESSIAIRLAGEEVSNNAEGVGQPVEHNHDSLAPTISEPKNTVTAPGAQGDVENINS
jgi:DNA-binding response OmpR family regulator